MDHLLYIVLTIFVISSVSAVSGFFYSRYRFAKSKVEDLRNQKDIHLDPLMSSSQLSFVAHKLIELRKRAKKLRYTTPPK